MNLSASILAKKLAEHHTLIKSKDLSREPILGRPIFYTNREQIQANQLYLVPSHHNPEDLPREAKGSLFILLGKYDGMDLTKYPSQFCIMPHSTDPGPVFNTIQEIYNQFDCWQEELYRSRLQEESLQHMLQMSHQILRGSLALMDKDNDIIACAGRQKTSVLLSHIASLSLDPDRYLVREIKNHGITTHRLLLFPYNEKVETDYNFLLAILGNRIEHALSHNQLQEPRRDKSLHRILSTILADRTADYVTTSQRLDSLEWYARNEYLCLVVKTGTANPKKLSEAAICDYIENAVPACCAFSHRENIVAFIDITKARISLSSIAERLGFFIRDNRFRIGYSRIMTGHFNLRRQYLQAKISLGIGERKSPGTFSYEFNDVSFEYILEQATRNLPGYMISHEKLLRMKEIDAYQNTEYMQSLKLYLDNQLNAVQTAKDLSIHRSTFLYRLDKIKSLLETTLEDPEEILYLMLSFRFIEMEDRRSLKNDYSEYNQS